MNRATRNTFRVDMIIQGVVLFPMLFAYTIGLALDFAIFGLFAQFFVGGVQLLSAAIHAVRFNDHKRRNYLIGALAYLAVLLFGGTTLVQLDFLPQQALGVLGFMGLLIVPTCMAVWYFFQTWKDGQVLAVAPLPTDTDNEDLLDDMFIKD